VTRAEVVIVGAGISGLACATELAANGVDDVLVLEAAGRAGGAAETVRRGEYVVERGPNTVRGNEALARLAQHAGLALVPAKRAAPSLVANGAVVPVPPPLGTLLRPSFLPWSAWGALLAEPLRRARPGPRTVRALVEERFGSAVAARFADVMTLGVFGASADQVGFEAAFPELADDLAAAGGRFSALALKRLLGRRSAPTRMGVVSTAHGLGGLCERLGERLGARLRLAAPVVRARGKRGDFELELGGAAPGRMACRELVLAVPPAASARVLELPGAAALLDAYRFVPQTLVAFALEEPACAARWTGLGFLVPPRECLPLIGCLFPSNLFEGRAPHGALLLAVFAARSLVEASDAALARELAPVLKRLLGAAREPVQLDVARYPLGIPLYDVEHRERTRALRAQLADAGGPLLCGIGYDGAGFAASAASGIAAARRLLDARGVARQ